MTSVAYSARALSDLERLFRFLVAENPGHARRVAKAIIDAIRILERHPYIGRCVRGEVRELVISRGRTGYVALYRVVSHADRIEILALRHQREAGLG